MLSNSFENHPNLPLFRLKSREKREEDKFSLFPLGKSGFIIVPEVRYNPNKGQFSMGNPTNFLCLKGVLYCFGIISVPDRAFLLKILSCTILP